MKVQTPIVIRPGLDPSTVDMTQFEFEPLILDWLFAKTPVDDMIDRIATAEKHFKAVEKWIKASREALKGRLTEPGRGEESVTIGHNFEAHYIKSVRSDIDRELVKTEMGGQWYADHCKTSEVLTLKLTPVTQTQSAPTEAGDEG